MEETKNETPVATPVDPMTKTLPSPEDTKKSAMDVVHGKLELLVNSIRNYSGSKKQLQMVLEAIAINPFNTTPYKFGYTHQQDLYNLFDEINNAKLVLLHVALDEQRVAQEIKNTTEEKKEDTNGNKQQES